MPTEQPAGASRRRPWALGILAALVVGGVLLATRGPLGQDPGGQLRVEVGEDPPPTGEPPTGEPAPAGAWRMLPEGPLSSRSGHVAVWTGRQMLVWGGERHGQPLTDGGAYDPVAETWRRLPPTGGLFGGSRPSEVAAVWTGQEMVVLGPARGRAYRPDDDTWRDLAVPPRGFWAPASAGWTGEEVVVLADGQRRAAGYDPDDDRWRELPDPPVTGDAGSVSAELLGSLVVVGAAQDGPAIARYDPRADAWSDPDPVPVGAGRWTPSAAADPVAGRVLLAGPAQGTGAAPAGAWSPGEGWQPLPDLPESLGGVPVDVAWTGEELLAWAGQASEGLALPSGSARWRSLAPSPLPARRGATAVWTGDELLVWGGAEDGQPRADGAALAPRRPPPPQAQPADEADIAGTWRRLPPGPLPAEGPAPGPVTWTGADALLVDEFTLSRVVAYDPEGGVWRAGPEAPRAQRRVGHTTAWTGEELVVIAAYHGGARRPLDGRAYNPATRTWRELSPAPADSPAPVVATWTGREIVVVAGHVGPRALAYDPAVDGWRRLPAPPSPRGPVALAWTGREVLALDGGAGGRVSVLDPDAGTWRRGAASPVAPHVPPAAAAWTGTEWIVHGGRGGPAAAADGAAYDPRTDTWRTLDAPPQRVVGAVATGWDAHPLLVVGPEEGLERDPPPTPRLYDPGARAWRSLPPLPPWLRSVHAAAWTGEQLLVWADSATAAAFTPAAPDT